MPENEAGFGMVSWYRGEFDSARAKLETVAAVRSDVDVPEIGSVWFMPNEPIASIHTHLAMARLAQGDLAGADTALAKAHRRCALLGFPQGAVSLSYARQMEVLIRCEAGQLDRAALVVAELSTAAEQHGFTAFAAVGAAQQVMVDGLSALATGSADGATLQGHAEALSEFADRWRAQEVKYLIPSYDAVVARLLIASARHVEARARTDAGLALAAETGMHYYDAELLRIRARTHSSGEQRLDDLDAAARLARGQGAKIFELRSTTDGFELARRTAAGRVDRRRGWSPLRRRVAGARTRTGTARVRRSPGRVVILGGGMAGLSAAWRLSEPGWRDRFESITVYQRGWRLGGKGASSRGTNGRIEEHGLHIWLGSYENAFTLLRECYAELDRSATDPSAPIHSVGPGLDPGRQPRAGRALGKRMADLVGHLHPQR